ncbi:fumarate reductase/succinate dehydrogenase flavoprotein subunit [Nocardioides rotundus]|uniref:fumarate reductase/succinate dehydrogenase flavoprotein subunit n=1 Tax=Nocardioides rotundus TaxID=1774216 RepID=UPI001CC1873E|nr:fumarate reductase/succinate dehydrogenase flavoprotein subunit [Nocardioides rotundus]UAL30605.1 fumarate reductase/succinate dehydrogenase flavoprotein subunit [Nocardioides rotundus]
MNIPEPTETEERHCDVLVIGGGTAGTMAAITAAEAGAQVLLLEKAHVRHSGALAMGMDGVNNAVIPGKATPEDYVAEITRANDGIVNQATIRQTATRGYDMVRRLERYGVKFEKDEYGDYAVRRVHRSGSYVLPMPEGKDVKKVLYRVMRKREIRQNLTIENRLMPVRVLTAEGRAVGAAALHTRTGGFVTVSAGAVILATGACGRLGLPASGYLYGTYENPTNAGDGYAMAYHAGAELSGIECFQVNPLIKDYNGPACAYVANPFGSYQVNADGERFVDCDYWSGQMMAEVKEEIDSARGPIYLKTTHLPEETVSALEGILHHTERPTRGTFHSGRGHDYRTHDVEMHISEIGLCGGHSSSGVWVDENAQTTVPGLYAAGDLACVPHNYMIGAFVFGDLAGTHASAHLPSTRPELPADQVAAAHELVYRPLRNPDGPPQPQVEYKLRRFVNDYVAPPKTGRKLAIAIESFDRMAGELEGMGGRTPHELMRCAEVTFIRDCAELAARASMVREESRWGLYHARADLPLRDDDAWFFHLNVRRRPDGGTEFVRRPVAEYVVPVEGVTIPASAPDDVAVIASVEPRQLVTGRRSGPAGAAATRSPRLLELLELADSSPDLGELDPFLVDAEPAVRRAAVATLTEVVPAGFGPALVARLEDEDASVRSAAAHALRELVEVVPATEEVSAALHGAASVADPVGRAAVLDVLRGLRLGTVEDFSAALADEDHRVRLQAVSGLVSLDAVEPVARATADAEREVRVAAVHGLGTIGSPASEPVLADLAGDPELLVRAAALESLGALGGSPDSWSRSAEGLSDRAWRVRVGAVRGLAGAPDDVAVPPLLPALEDEHADVRKAAVIALSERTGDDRAVEALERATKDTDADVRGYARRALHAASRVAAS